MKILVALLVVVAAACGDDDGHGHFDAASGQPDGAAPGGPDGAPGGGPDASAAETFDVGGVVSGDPAAQTKVMALWTVTSGSDYLYKYGEGTVDDAELTFLLRLPGDPPAEALNGGSLGVATLVLVGGDVDVADGVVDDATIETLILGFTGQHAVIFNGAGSVGVDWEADFQDGYSCAECVPAQGGGFDGWAPVDCSEVDLMVGDLDSLPVCNWT